MGLLKFDYDEVRELCDHTRSCTRFRKGYRQKPIPALFLVSDEGVYLMSGGLPHLPNPAKPESSKLAYAEGCDPTVEDLEWWDEARELAGGTDFVEVLPLALFDNILDLGLEGVRITINLGATRLTVSYTGCKKTPKKPTKKPAAAPTGDDLDF